MFGSIGMNCVINESSYKGTILQRNYFRNELNFLNEHGIMRIMNTLGILQS